MKFGMGYLLVLLLLELPLLRAALERVGQPEELGLHRHAVAARGRRRALGRRRRHHHVEVVDELRGVRVERDVRPARQRRRRVLVGGRRRLPHRAAAALQLLGREDVLRLGLECKEGDG